MHQIGHSRPTIREEDYRAVARVLGSGWLARGSEVDGFERELAHYVGTAGGACVSSGTAALHLALRALGLGEGRAVAVPGYCCASVLDGVRLAGCRPVPVDVDPLNLVTDAGDLARAVRDGASAVVLVHLLGYPGPAGEAVDTGVPVIEDLAQSLGARIDGRRVGSSGAASVCSFYATKLITTGEGGMVLSGNGEVLASVRRMRSARSHPGNGAFAYEMSDLQAALGRSQLAGFEAFLEKRRSLARAYRDALHGSGLRFVPEREGVAPASYRFVVGVPGRDVGDIIRRMQIDGVECRRPFDEPVYRFTGGGDLSGCREAYETLLSLPLYPSLEVEQVERIAERLRGILEEGVGS
jgi:perosamine synthetase